MRIEARQGCTHRVHGMTTRHEHVEALPSSGIDGRGNARGSARAGFTIVELLVALMIIAVGMLGLAATAGSVTRMMGGAKRQVLAATIAQTRLERLRSSPCASIVSGADTTRGIINKWTVSAVVRGVNVTDSVTFPTSRTSKGTRAYFTTIPC
jgi:type IV pilus modification protein PilV